LERLPVEKGGLGGAWRSVLEAIEFLGSSYPLVNRVISLGIDRAVRRLGVALSSITGGRVLDAGAGDGSLSAVLRERMGGRPYHLILLDPSEKMLRLARRTAGWHGSDAVIGLLERAPLRANSIEAVFMAFALRDVISLQSAVERLAEILKPGGVFTVIDIAKPDSGLASTILAVYWRLVAPLLAAIVDARAWGKVRLIYTTYTRLPRESELIRLLAGSFMLVKIWRGPLGAVHIIVMKRRGEGFTDSRLLRC